MKSIDFQNCFIVLLLCFLSFLSYSLLFKKPKDGYHLPPSPPSLPIIGHLHHLLSALTHKSLQKLSFKYGPLLHLRVFNVHVLLVSSSSSAYEIFRAHDVNVSSRGVTAIDESLMFGSSGFICAPYGDYWKFMKKLMTTKVLRPQALERSIGIRAEELDMFYKTLLDKAMKKESVEILKETVRFVNNSLCRMTMGRSCTAENNEAERVLKLCAELGGLAKKFFLQKMLRKLLEKLGISLFKNEIMGVSNRLEKLMERILLEHEKKLDDGNQGNDIMDTLLEAYGDENAEYKITRKHIKSLFAELFLGATDTSSTATQWTMGEIINNPRVFERLREEIDSVVGKTRLIQETDLLNLPYLRAVVKEGLRLHPPTPLIVREFQEGCKIGEFYVPKNTVLVVNGYAMMRDPESWEDPDEFKPERFLAPDEDIKEKTLNYLPFGSGRRACTGANLGSTFVGTAIGVMVQCFDWEFKQGKVSMEEATGRFFVTMTNPLRGTPIPRTLNLMECEFVSSIWCEVLRIL